MDGKVCVCVCLSMYLSTSLSVLKKKYINFYWNERILKNFSGFGLVQLCTNIFWLNIFWLRVLDHTASEVCF
jgi:hypothetical protein